MYTQTGNGSVHVCNFNCGPPLQLALYSILALRNIYSLKLRVILKFAQPRVCPHTVYAIYFASLNFRESGPRSREVKFAIEEESNGRRNQYLSFTHFQKAKLAILPCTVCNVYCTTRIAYTSRIHASGSEVNIFTCEIRENKTPVKY